LIARRPENFGHRSSEAEEKPPSRGKFQENLPKQFGGAAGQNQIIKPWLKKREKEGVSFWVGAKEGAVAQRRRKLIPFTRKTSLAINKRLKRDRGGGQAGMETRRGKKEQPRALLLSAARPPIRKRGMNA